MQVKYSYPSPPGSSLTGASLETANTPLITRSLSGDSLPLGGHLIAVETPAAAGTLTLLKLIAGVLYPTEGWLHTPAHLRTVLVHEAQILKDTLWNNLTVGVTSEPPPGPRYDAWRAHVWSIAEALGLSKALIGNDNVRVGEGGGVLRLVDRQIVSLARAFVSDPHLLLLNKPTAIFEQGLRNNFFRLLGQWTRREGIFAASHESFLRGEAESAAVAGGPSLSISSNEFKVRLINRTVNLMPRDVIFSTAEGVSLPRETTHLATFELQRRTLQNGTAKEWVTCKVQEYSKVAEHSAEHSAEPSTER